MASNRNEIRAIQADLVFGDDATPVSMGTLPPNSIITAIKVLVSIAFNSTGTDLVIVGTSLDDNKFADAVDVSAVGSASVTQLLTGVIEDASASTEIFAEYNQSIVDAANGACKVVIEYFQE